jgi:hypothetical protein
MDNLEFLDAGQPANGEVAPTPQAEAPTQEAAPVTGEQPTEPVAETAEQKATRERDERGRFKAKEADEPVMVPLKALHETRDEVKALKAQLEALNRPQQEPQVPDMFADPEGYQAYLAHSVRETVLNQTLNISEEMTRQQAGDEIVNEATEWARQAFQANPAFYQSFIQQRNPYGFLISEYRRQQAFSQIGDPKEIEAFLAWKQAQSAAPQPGATPQPQPQRPTGSIASAPSAGGAQHIATGPGVAFDNVIK